MGFSCGVPFLKLFELFYFKARCICLYSLSCLLLFFTYSFITVSFWFLPSVAAKYPSVQNSPPHNFFFTWGTLKNICLAMTDLITVTSSVGDFVGSDCIKKCTWSLSTPTSRKWIYSYRSSIPRQILFRWSSNCCQRQPNGILSDKLYGKQDCLRYAIT